MFVAHDGAVTAGPQGVTSIFDDRWHHLAGVLREGLLEIYVDGVLEDSTAFPNPISYDGNPVSIGNDLNGASWVEGVFGVIDEVRIHDCGLTASQVLASFQTCREQQCNPTVPTVSKSGFVMMSLLVLAAATIAIQRQRRSGA